MFLSGYALEEGSFASVIRLEDKCEIKAVIIIRAFS